MAEINLEDSVLSKVKEGRLQMRVDALSYRIPMAIRECVVIERCHMCDPLCPRCDAPIDQEFNQYCICCGQRLSWVLWDKHIVDLFPPHRQRESYVGREIFRELSYVLEHIVRELDTSIAVKIGIMLPEDKSDAVKETLMNWWVWNC